MSYMVFSQYTGDTSTFTRDMELVRPKFEAQGALRVTGSIVLTGETAGSFTVASIWNTADAYFDARPQVVGDPEVRAMMQSKGMAPLGTAFTELYGETGTPEGKYAVSVIAASEGPNPEAEQAVVEAASNVMETNGVNGMRFTRAIAAGQQSGIYIAIAYTESIDSYLAASAAASTDSDFVSAMTNAKAQIVMRQFNLMD
jgi:hypothetical protein